MNNPFFQNGDNQNRQKGASDTPGMFGQNTGSQPNTGAFGSNFPKPFGSMHMPPNQPSSSISPQNAPLSGNAPPGPQFGMGNSPFSMPAAFSPNVPHNTAQQPTMPPSSSLFGSTQQNTSPASGINPLSSNAGKTASTDPLGATPASLFASNASGASTMSPGSSQQAYSNPFGSQQQFGTQMPTTPSNIEAPSVKDATFDQPRKSADESSLMSSLKDNSVNLYNLTLQEVIDRHSSILEANIRDFERDAQSIFERDLQLIKNKNSYISIRNKIDEENVRLDELSQVLDYFEERLSSIEDEQGSGCVADSAKVVEDFEAICDRFYRKIESFKDEQGDVLDLVNENYQIIENIDKKLDILSQLRDVK